MLYKFIDDQGTFRVKDPCRFNTYFPLTDKEGRILCAIAPNLSGDIKKDNDRFITPPASIEDLRNNLLCKRNFFIKTRTGIIDCSNNCAQLEAGLLYHKLTKITKELKIELLTFVPHDIPVETTKVTVTNKTKKPVRLTATSFMPLYGRSEKNIRDHRHVSSLLNRVNTNKNGIFLRPTMIFDEKGHQENKTQYFCYGIEGNGLGFTGQFPTLDYFCGEGNLAAPDAIYKHVRPAVKYSCVFDGKEACGAFQFKTKTLKPGASVTYILLTGAEEETDTINSYFSRLDSPKKVDAALKDTKDYWQKYLANLNFNFGDKNLDGWLIWVKLQPTLRKLFGCSFLPHFDYGKGGRGWRDLWQDALTLLLTEPAAAKALIVKSFEGVRIDGSNATIIAKDNSFLSDRNKISRVWMDHGVWPWLTLRLYLNRTNDLEILLKTLPYYRDHLLKRAKEVDKAWHGENILRTQNNEIYQGSILEHLLVQTLSAFYNVGEHNTIKLENADWNDGLDMAADKGESVAFSFMYAHNLKDICTYLKRLSVKNVSLAKEIFILLKTEIDHDDYRAKQGLLNQYLETAKHLHGVKCEITVNELTSILEQKAKTFFDQLNRNEWLSEGFFNGYYDNHAQAFEGKIGSKIRMTLTGQVFPLLSGAVTPSHAKKVWQSAMAILYDKQLGGFRLNTDLKDICLKMGRAFGFAYGDKENGAVFSHMAVMFAHALYKNNMAKEGWVVLSSLYKMAQKERAKIYPVLPEYFNSQGQGLYLYLTGSASWFIYTLLEETLGVKFILGDLVIEPKLIPENFKKKTISASFDFEQKRIAVVFHQGKAKTVSVIDRALVNGQTFSPVNGRVTIAKSYLAEVKKLDIEVYLK
jgi:cellobiose phosphorylase